MHCTHTIGQMVKLIKIEYKNTINVLPVGTLMKILFALTLPFGIITKIQKQFYFIMKRLSFNIRR